MDSPVRRGAGQRGRAGPDLAEWYPAADADGLADKLNKSRPLGAEDLWLIEQDLNQQLQAGTVAEPLSPDPLSNPLLNLESTGECRGEARVAGVPGS